MRGRSARVGDEDVADGGVRRSVVEAGYHRRGVLEFGVLEQRDRWLRRTSRALEEVTLVASIALHERARLAFGLVGVELEGCEEEDRSRPHEAVVVLGEAVGLGRPDEAVEGEPVTEVLVHPAAQVTVA